LKFEIAVDAEIIADLFQPDFSDTSRLERKKRLNYHILLTSNQLRERWEEKMKQMGLFPQFSTWLPQALASRQSMKLISHKETTGKEVLIEVAKNSQIPIVVGEFTLNELRENQPVRFCDQNIFSQPHRQIVTMDQVKEIQNRGGKVRHWFSLFETSIHLEVNANQSADLLAEYLSYFFDEEMLIQDKYFINNENNFDTYIFPRLPSLVNLTIIIPTQQGSTHKSRLEKKYGATVKCYDQAQLHEGFIKTKQYKISIPYRLNMFGTNGRTTKESINITKRT